MVEWRVAGLRPAIAHVLALRPAASGKFMGAASFACWAGIDLCSAFVANDCDEDERASVWVWVLLVGPYIASKSSRNAMSSTMDGVLITVVSDKTTCTATAK